MADLFSGKYTEPNKTVIKLGLKRFAEEEAKKYVVERMYIIAERLIEYIDNVFNDNSEEFPEWTANLHDATGIGIYVDGHVNKLLPIQRAEKAQQSKIGEEIWGTEELYEAIKLASTKFSKGLWLVMFSAVDYAERIESSGSPAGRGADFFTKLCEQVGINTKDQFGTAIISISGANASFFS